MAHNQHTPSLLSLDEAITVLFCLIDDTYAFLNPAGQNYESIKKLSDSEVITLALFQQLRGTESERSFLPDVQRFSLSTSSLASQGCTPPRCIGG